MSDVSPVTTDLGEEYRRFSFTHDSIVCGREAGGEDFLEDVNGEFANLGDKSTMFGYRKEKGCLFVLDLSILLVKLLELGR